VVALRNTKLYNHLSYISSEIVPLCKYAVLSATIKVLGTFLIVILWKSFQYSRRILDDVRNITKVPSLQCWSQPREQVKNSWSQIRRAWGMFQCCRIVLCYEILDQNLPVCWSIAVKEKPNVGSPIFGTFPSDHIPQATKDIIVRFFNHSNVSCKLYQQIVGTFWSYWVYRLFKVRVCLFMFVHIGVYLCAGLHFVKYETLCNGY